VYLLRHKSDQRFEDVPLAHRFNEQMSLVGEDFPAQPVLAGPLGSTAAAYVEDLEARSDFFPVLWESLMIWRTKERLS
jgi:hypothetical protein